MIKKVPNMNCWVMKWKDFQWWLPTSSIHYCSYIVFSLPLFELRIKPFWTVEPSSNDDLIGVMDTYIHRTRDITFEQMDVINKTWNEFYESKNKET